MTPTQRTARNAARLAALSLCVANLLTASAANATGEYPAPPGPYRPPEADAAAPAERAPVSPTFRDPAAFPIEPVATPQGGDAAAKPAASATPAPSVRQPAAAAPAPAAPSLPATRYAPAYGWPGAAYPPARPGWQGYRTVPPGYTVAPPPQPPRFRQPAPAAPRPPAPPEQAQPATRPSEPGTAPPAAPARGRFRPPELQGTPLE
ncbi:MAG: hypothetical protein P8106_02520 [Gammaproteobacteria bacterium]